MKGKKRYEIGLEKLANAAAEVTVMQKVLEDLQPALVQASENVAATVKEVETESAEAAIVEKNVMADELVADEQVNFNNFSFANRSILSNCAIGPSCTSNQRRMRCQFS